MKFALISEANFRGKVTGYKNNIFDWIRIWDGEHYPYLDIQGKWEILDKYDVVMLGDVDRRLEDVLSIIRNCKCKKIFYPEGTIQIFTRLPFDHQRLFYELLEKVDLIGAVEENRMQWYESLWKTKVFFLQAPTSPKILKGAYKSKTKADYVLVCCNLGMDETRYQTNLISSLGVLRKTGKKGFLCEVQNNQVWFFKEKMNVNIVGYSSRLELDGYLTQLVMPAKVILNPSGIIGTSRNAIIGAGCGTPVIGNRDSHTQMRLFPELGTYIYDVKKMAELVNRLYEDDKFYKEICDYAFSKLDYYSIENAKKRFEDAVNGVM